MLGSPNYGIYVTNGTQANEEARAASVKLQNLFVEFIKEDQNINCSLIDIDYLSDQKSFYDASIPTVLVHGGSQDIKTIEQREMFGGEAGAPMDACADSACDDILNVNSNALTIFCNTFLFYYTFYVTFKILTNV